MGCQIISVEVFMIFLRKYRTINKYKKYREIGKVLNHKIIDRFVDKESILQSGKFLGLVKRDTLITDNKSEIIALIDFSINEYQINGKKAVKLYKEKVLLENDIEGEILDALIKSYTSLFKIADIKQRDNKLFLADLFNKDSDPIEIIDIGFSQTAPTGLLIFLRIVPFADFNITGGFGFAFNGDLEENLLREYKHFIKRVKYSSESIKRYVAFFKLHRRCGIETAFR
jgi:hypothetical protein